jgi:DNA-binding transcriptional MerR regulator
MNSFERVYARLERRQRLLHGLSALSGTLLITLGLTAIALIVESMRIVPTLSPVWWLGGNLVLGGLAFAWGWLRHVNRTSTIFRADRNAHCDEKLITLYELSLGQGPKEFLPLLVSRLETLRFDLSTALPIPQGERRRWLGVLALALLCAGMTSVVPPGGFLWDDTPEGAVSTQPPESAPISQVHTAELLQAPPTAIAEKLPALRSRLEQARAALAQNPNDARARAILHQLQEEIRQEQNRLLNLPPEEQPSPPTAEKSSDDASLVENPSGDVRPPDDSSPQGQSALDRLMQALRELQGQAQGLSPEEMQKLLEQLQQKNPEAVSIAQRALQTAQNDEEFSKRLEEALKNLEARRDLHQQLEQLQREAQSALAQSETARSDTQTPGSPESAQPSQEGTQNSQETNSAESPEGARQENAISKPSGGRGQAPLDPEAVKDLPDLSQLRERTRSTSVPAPQEEQLEILFEIVSIGLPQNPDTPGQSVPVQIDYQKVEALIDALEIPAELREAVRQYFLSLARR